MHRAIMQPAKGMDVDHINGNRLDNRRSNLRVVTRSQNLTNRKGAMPKSKTGIRGVCFDKARGQWVAQAKLNGRSAFRKRFNSIGEATEAAKSARKRLGFLEGAAQ